MLGPIVRFLTGSILIEATGNSELFLNEIYKRNLKLYMLKKSGHLSISFTVGRKDYGKIKQLANSTHTRLEIVKKQGMPQILKRFSKRYGIAVGSGLCIVFFYLFSLFIWNIEVSGCEKTTKQEVVMLLEQSGISFGKFKSFLDIKNIENEFLKGNDKISWVSINLKGTTAYVEIREKNEKVKLLDAKTPCSIYASRDGVIASVHTYMGYSVVSVGDTVTAGDLIVTGNYTDKYGVEYKLHSYAKIMAYTVHSHSVNIPFNSKQHVKTGRFKNKYSIKLLRFNIPLYFIKNIRYNNYDITMAQTELKLGKHFVLPVSIVKTTYTEVEDVIVKKSEEVALMEAYEQLYDFEYNLVGIVVNDRHYEKTKDENGLTVKVLLDCYEQIGVTGQL